MKGILIVSLSFHFSIVVPQPKNPLSEFKIILMLHFKIKHMSACGFDRFSQTAVWTVRHAGKDRKADRVGHWTADKREKLT